MSYQIYTEDKGLYIYLSGDVTFKQIRFASAEGWEHKNRYSNDYQIWDFRNVDAYELKPQEAILSAKMDNLAFSNFGKFTKIAIITERDVIIERYMTFKSHIDKNFLDVEIFKFVGEAQKWCLSNDSKYFSPAINY